MDIYFLWKQTFPGETKVNMPKFSSINNLDLKIRVMSTINTLEAISPIDGRYRRIPAPLADYCSEKALQSYRTEVEGE